VRRGSRGGVRASLLVAVLVYGYTRTLMDRSPQLPPPRLFPLAICVTLTPAALYLGLLNFRRRLNTSFLALYMVAVGALLGSTFVESLLGRQLLWIAPVALVAIGCVLRALARRRWYGIDWLRFRAERETSPFAVRRA
jgi:hypothetical protein